MTLRRAAKGLQQRSRREAEHVGALPWARLRAFSVLSVWEFEAKKREKKPWSSTRARRCSKKSFSALDLRRAPLSSFLSAPRRILEL